MKTQTRVDARYCDYCGMQTMSPEELDQHSAKLAEQSHDEAVRAEVLKTSETIHVNTLPVSIDEKKIEVIGMVFGTSSKQAFWGLSTQADRLSRAYSAALSNLKYEAALVKADAVVGVTFALNNSTGSGATMLAGSSEAVMLLGTAIKYKKSA
jgi:uncharacterized protein YbjQ (UPF0145 family)